MRSRTVFSSFSSQLSVLGAIACLASAGSAYAGADLSLGKTADREPALAGGVLVYTLSVTNDGPDAATDVVVLDTLPSQVTWISDTCPDAPPPGNVVTCSLGSIAASATATAEISVIVSPTATGSISNSATVSGTQSDPDPVDNLASLVSQVSVGADISSGTATNVGITPVDGIGDAAIRIRGSFNLPAAGDQLGSTLTITELLSENGAGGAGELVKALGGGPLLPVTLTPRRARATDAIYQTPSDDRPAIRVEVKNRPRGSNEYEFNLTIKRSVIPGDPLLCAEPAPMETPETALTTRFRVTGPGIDAQVSGTGTWKCFLGDPDNKLRARTGNGSSGPSSGEPSASLRTEMLTSNPGADDVQLDGSQSEDDAPGTIVAYQFWVVDLDTDAVVAGPIVTASSVVVVTLPPGDYRGYLTVTDNDNLSDTESRGFSVK
jgi:uncharacterized repeat protein (TIGR01451 family)